MRIGESGCAVLFCSTLHFSGTFRVIYHDHVFGEDGLVLLPSQFLQLAVWLFKEL